ncbi:hypothetical protein BRAS3843_3040047 [Bradyrhizobium sp. STM 3843]|nr:hypothetical protein BRAS3843_3040047 [Bradyrhizobium sp. STM 3843]
MRRAGVSMTEVVIDVMADGNPASLTTCARKLKAYSPGGSYSAIVFPSNS